MLAVRSRGLVGVFVSFLLLAGCGGDGSPLESYYGPYGTYSLVSVDGEGLPYRTVQVDNDGNIVDVVIVSGSFTLRSDGTCTEEVKYDVSEFDYVADATYTMRGDQYVLEIDWPEFFTGTEFTVTLSPGTLTLNQHWCFNWEGEDAPDCSDFVLVYTR